MITVPIHKDVMAYEPKVLGMLTARTLAFTIVASVLGLGIGWLCLVPLNIDSSIVPIPVMIVTLPIWFFGYARPCGMKPEVLAPLWLRNTFLNQQLVYVSTPYLRGMVSPAGLSSQLRSERYPNVALRTQTNEYAKQRCTNGFELIDRIDALGL